MHTTFELAAVAVMSFCSGWMFFIAASVIAAVWLHFRHKLFEEHPSL